MSEKAYRIDFNLEWIVEHKSDYETYPAEFLASQLNNRKMYRAHAEGSFSVIMQLQVEENNSESAEKTIVDTVVDILGASVVNRLTLGPAEPSASETVLEDDDEQSLIDKIGEWRTKLYETMRRWRKPKPKRKSLRSVSAAGVDANTLHFPCRVLRNSPCGCDGGGAGS